MTDWREDEIADARRDIAALLRASLDGKQGDIDAILDGAGDRGTRGIAETLLGLASDSIVRLTVAVGLIADENEETWKAIATMDTGILTGEPDIRQAVEANIVRVQGEIIDEG